jgi:NADH-quinone oxidoreductase subunit L
MTPAVLIPWLPALAAVLCGLCCVKRSLRKLAAPICIASIAGAFALSVMTYTGSTLPLTVKAFSWITVGDFTADMSYFVDPLTIVMLFVVTGIGTLVAIYAAGYMAGDRGYARFFAYVSLFIFAMTSLVMADNLVLLYLGWEGVGLCSYLLIGYYYDKPSAVAAAKKAFIVNRIGDLGFALGIFLTFITFDTVSLSEVVAKARDVEQVSAYHLWIPFLLMLGAFGKSAQIPLYVWLPDAMEGPTPVSALIHAATMVTAGVYMIARLIPVFELSPYALPTVAAIGGTTALFAATIALCQYDLKRVFAYSTVSQLGYMFLGVGALSTEGGLFHLFTHAFFKALLFLTAGSVMHALAGQLDLRKMSGMRKVMPVTCWLMFVGCLALAGFPFLSGFYSKDMILAAAMERGLHGEPLFLVLAIMGLATAFITAFYTFRLWFRVFMGETRYEMGHDHHAPDDANAHHDHAHAEAAAADDPHRAPAHADAKHGSAGEASGSHGITVEHHHEPHEMPWLMNGPLVLLAVGSIFAGFVIAKTHWLGHMVERSTAYVAHGEHDAGLHVLMMVISGAIALTGIALAAWFHWFNRPAADAVAKQFPGVVRTLENKYWIDELFDAAIVTPLRTLGEVFFVIDRLVIDGVVALVGWMPGELGRWIRPLQHGRLQGYGLSMALGTAVVLLVIVWMQR